MSKFHIGKNGPAPCKATKGKCPLGGESGSENHYKTLEEAQAAWKDTNNFKNINKISKSKEKSSNNSEEKLPKDHEKTPSDLKKLHYEQFLGIGIPDKTFPYTTVAERAKIQEKIRELKPLYENYEHDYSKDSPSDRPGEVEFLKNYDPSKFTNEKVSETADNIIFKIDEGELKVLMIKRGGHPYKDHWAHPGGFIDNVKDDNGNPIRKETTQEAASRELMEETNIKINPSEILPVNTYDRPGRDPRMEVHMNTHVILFDRDVNFSAGDDAAEAEFVPVREIFDGSKDIAFDHKLSIKDALNFTLNK